MFDDPRRLYFFFDFISHNAWLAWNRVPALAQRHGLQFEPVPVLFAGLLNAHGQKGPSSASRWRRRIAIPSIRCCPCAWPVASCRPHSA